MPPFKMAAKISQPRGSQLPILKALHALDIASIEKPYIAHFTWLNPTGGRKPKKRGGKWEGRRRLGGSVCAPNHWVFQVHSAQEGNTSAWLAQSYGILETPRSPFPPRKFDPFPPKIGLALNRDHFLRTIPTPNLLCFSL